MPSVSGSSPKLQGCSPAVTTILLTRFLRLGCDIRRDFVYPEYTGRTPTS